MIGIVTDSTADLPLEYYSEQGVVMVPLRVRFGTEEHADWQDMAPVEFCQRLSMAKELPKTSQPTPEEFLKAYTELGERCEAVISLHLSSKLSGTYSSAKMAAGEAKVPVHVVDTGLASVAVGMVVDEVVRARTKGGDLQALTEVANRAAASTSVFFVVETLKYLEMGGRIGKAQALAGSILQVRPVLTLRDGEVAVAAKARGTQQAVELAAVKIATAASALDRPRLVFAHASAAENCNALRMATAKHGIDVSAAPERWIGSVIGTYLGPGGFAVGACDSRG